MNLIHIIIIIIFSVAFIGTIISLFRVWKISHHNTRSIYKDIYTLQNYLDKHEADAKERFSKICKEYDTKILTTDFEMKNLMMQLEKQHRELNDIIETKTGDIYTYVDNRFDELQKDVREN